MPHPRIAICFVLTVAGCDQALTVLPTTNIQHIATSSEPASIESKVNTADERAGGFATDEQVESIMKRVPVRESPYFVARETIFNEIGFEEAKLNCMSNTFSMNCRTEVWQVSPSYRLTLDSEIHERLVMDVRFFKCQAKETSPTPSIPCQN